MTSTYTVAALPVSKATFDEIHSKLKEAGYDHAFMADGNIDMHGIALQLEVCPTCGEPYTKPPTKRALFCSNGFHCCRDCVWEDGRRITVCSACLTSNHSAY